MYKIKTNDNGKLMLVGKYIEEPIHVIYCNETIDGLKDGVATQYVVAEECTNHARIYLVTDFSENGKPYWTYHKEEAKAKVIKLNKEFEDE